MGQGNIYSWVYGVKGQALVSAECQQGQGQGHVKTVANLRYKI